MLLKSLVVIGAVTGLVLGLVGTSVPWLFPKLFSSDPCVIKEVRKIVFPFSLCMSSINLDFSLITVLRS